MKLTDQQAQKLEAHLQSALGLKGVMSLDVVRCNPALGNTVYVALRSEDRRQIAELLVTLDGYKLMPGMFHVSEFPDESWTAYRVPLPPNWEEYPSVKLAAEAIEHEINTGTERVWMGGLPRYTTLKRQLADRGIVPRPGVSFVDGVQFEREVILLGGYRTEVIFDGKKIHISQAGEGVALDKSQTEVFIKHAIKIWAR